MKRNAGNSWISLLAILSIGAVILTTVLNIVTVQKLKSRETTLGYPARPEQIEHDGVYFVQPLMTDRWWDRTNNYATLQRVTIQSPREYTHNRTNRLFEIPYSIPERGYYRFYKTGTNLSFDQIPPPNPQ